MRRSRRTHTQRLRSAVDALPVKTKLGMLDGISSNRVIVGAYTDKRGGVCPMLAAHRHGGRTDFSSFARAWDSFTGAKRARRASTREVRTLKRYLEAALIREGVTPPQPGALDPATGWIGDRPLADEVRDIQATRRRLAETEAREVAGVTVEELLTKSHVADEQRRSEQRARDLLGDEAAPQPGPPPVASR